MVLQLFVFIPMQVYYEKEQAKKGELQDGQFEEERSNRMSNGATACVQADKHIKK